MKILIVSSKSPYWCASLGYNHAKHLMDLGHEVEFLSKDEIDDPEPWMHFVYTKAQTQARQQAYLDNCSRDEQRRLRKFVNGVKSWVWKHVNPYLRHIDMGPVFSIVDERHPQVPVTDLIATVKGRAYDRVEVLFWWEMLSSVSLKALYDEFHAPLVLHGIDMSIMTGGCHYFGDCRGFRDECRKCLARRLYFKHKNRAHRNFLVKKEVYSQIETTVLLNTWMRGHFLDSGLFKPEQLRFTPLYLDENFFRPLDVAKAREEAGIPVDRFVILCGATRISEMRKGLNKVPEMLGHFSKAVGDTSKCLLIVAGNGRIPECCIETRYVGNLDASDLARMYAMADVFISPTLDDAGPSMVNQALMCGTPVVAYEIGTAIDVVHTGRTGYRARYADRKDFGRGIAYIYNYPDKDGMRRECRRLSLELSSFAARDARGD